ncbi:putative 4-coumarate-CoA ligase 3 [Smittium mucronatum]|uniref:Putative 4-coumarate-CoA ligase 3 n=1 Tax=Smittium mucronatum TaxID=133383 RepID=A0A1R0GME3_9FUNG|nr:putative 4-coumarate-CoA ligase 3 [Smittium mucronatum]
MIFSSKFKDVQIPDVDIPTFMLEMGKRSYKSAEKNVDYAIKDYSTGKSFTIEDLESQSVAFASGLVNDMKLGKDDVVAIFSQNSIYYPVVIFGTLMMGGIATLVNPTYSPRELAHQLVDSGAKVIVTKSDLLQQVKEAIAVKGVDLPASRILVMDTIKDPKGLNRHLSDIYSNLPFSRYSIKSYSEAKDKVAILSYSSGTTGLSKGVMLTHKNILTAAIINSNFSNMDGHHDRSVSPPVYISMLPFYHIYGLVINLFIGLMNSAGLVVLEKFDIHTFFKLLQDEKVTFAHLVPPVIISMINEPGVQKYDLSNLKLVMTGAAPLGKDVLVKFCEKYKGVSVVIAYGMTETSPSVSVTFRDHPFDGSSGVLLSNTQAKVVDDEGKELGPNQIGELCFKGMNVMKGYLNNPKATKNSVDFDGFYHTGDVGYIDLDTNIFIVDRIKELIKYKGFQVPPAELESLLLLHEDVADSAVIGVQHEDLGTELPKAYVRLTSNHDGLSGDHKEAKANEILAWVNGQVAPHKKLRGGVEVLDIIPKSASGKILRRQLRQMENNRLKLTNGSSKL